MAKNKMYEVHPKKKDDMVIFRQSGYERAMKEKPRHEVNFRTGAHKTNRDRPRDKTYKKWRKEDEL